MAPSAAGSRLVACAALSVVALAAQPSHAATPQSSIALWPDGVPERQAAPTARVIEEREANGGPNRSAMGVAEPTLDVFPADAPNGQALLIVPGGGYQRVVFDKEGYDVATWFNRRGISAFVLTYRLPGETWTNRSDVPLQDAQRALRFIRAHAADYGLRTDAIGVMGFSAGGHLAGTLAVAFDREVYPARDDVDRMSARPDFAVLMYPVVSMKSDITHAGSRQNLLGAEPSAASVSRYSVEDQVRGGVPPMLLVHAMDDPAVPVENSLELYRALEHAGVPADMHLFAVGGHGFGLTSPPDLPVARWPEIVADWLAAQRR